MHKLAIALISTVTISTAAHAEPFSGAYLGAELNHDAYEVKASNVDLGDGTAFSFDGLSGNGVGGGLYAGYDIPFGNDFFVGAEANFNYSDAGISVSATDGIDTTKLSVKARESFGLSARLGGKLNASTGVYARLGWQKTKFNSKEEDNGVETFSDSRSEDAFVYGAGLETYFTHNASVRAEYTVQDYSSAGLNEELGVNGINVKNGKLAVGFSWHF